MNAPLRHEPAPSGSREELRQDIGDMLEMVQVQAHLGATYAAIGDDTGLAYALMRLVAYTRAATGSFNDLRQNDGGAHDEA
jgi:hypothetical protein